MLRLLIDIVLLPFTIIWKIIEIIFRLTGKLLTVSIGLCILIIGLILCLTLIGLPLGICLVIFGLLMIIKGIL